MKTYNKRFQSLLAAIQSLPDDKRGAIFVNEPPPGETFEILGGLCLQLKDIDTAIAYLSEIEQHKNNPIIGNLLSLPAASDNEGCPHDFI